MQVYIKEKGIRVLSPRSSLYALYRQYEGERGMPYPCRGARISHSHPIHSHYLGSYPMAQKGVGGV